MAAAVGKEVTLLSTYYVPGTVLEASFLDCWVVSLTQPACVEALPCPRWCSCPHSSSVLGCVLFLSSEQGPALLRSWVCMSWSVLIPKHSAGLGTSQWGRPGCLPAWLPGYKQFGQGTLDSVAMGFQGWWYEIE